MKTVQGGQTVSWMVRRHTKALIKRSGNQAIIRHSRYSLLKREGCDIGATLADFYRKDSRPVGANRAVVPGAKDLESRFPHLAREWHPTRNGGLKPCQVTFGTKRKVWWRYQKGHEWRASVQSRTLDGTGCPVCAGRVILPGENDMASQFPEVAKQWHPTKNQPLLPSQVTPTSKRRVWWRCPLGHEYIAAVGMRTMRNSACPYCAGKKVLAGFNDLATTQPQIADQWHPTLNGTLTPRMVTAGSHKKVWWICAEGHIWKAAVYSRTGKQKRGCPVCAGVVNGKRKAQYERTLAEARRLMAEEFLPDPPSLQVRCEQS